VEAMVIVKPSQRSNGDAKGSYGVEGRQQVHYERREHLERCMVV
jgi:hypothetical protein